MSASVTSPFTYFTDRSGEALNGGMIFIGVPGVDPTSVPQAAFWDSALSIPAAQPLRTTGGLVYRAGAPARFYTAGDYSIAVHNSNNERLFVSLNESGASLDGGSIILTNGETLTAQAGASVSLEDGANFLLGNAEGVGSTFFIASNATFQGSITPTDDNVFDIGSPTARYQAIHTAAVATSTLDSVTIRGGTVVGYADDTEATSPTVALALNQQKNVVACGRISSAGVVGTNHFNVDSVTPVGNTLVALLDEPIDDDAVVIVQPTGTSSGLEARAAVAAGGASITFTMYSGGVAGLLNITFVAFGRPRGGIVQP